MRHLITLTCWVFPVATQAMWGGPKGDVPVDRILRNEMEALRKNPKDAEAAYHLGRVHSYIFATRATKAPITYDGRAFFRHDIDIRMKRSAGTPTAAEFQNLRYSINYYRLATKLDPTRGLATLGLAWSLEEASHYGEAVGPISWIGTPLSKEAFARESSKAYRLVYTRNIKREQKMGRFSLGQSNDSLSTDAIDGLFRVDKTLTTAQRAAYSTEIGKISYGAMGMTPIIFPLDRVASLKALKAPEARVTFDLVGDGQKRTWSWVRPTAAILCWDPKRTGKITSGRQLFGPGTFWMMYRDGYAALAALDDDRSGWLTKRELDGISVWTDRNSNGTSEPGEVRPVTQMGITGIATCPTGRLPELTARVGIRFADGRTSPSYDWIATMHLAVRSKSS